jgi:hypothetical protein
MRPALSGARVLLGLSAIGTVLCNASAATSWLAEEGLAFGAGHNSLCVAEYCGDIGAASTFYIHKE